MCEYIISGQWSNWREYTNGFYIEDNIIYGAIHKFPEIYNFAGKNPNKNYIIVTEGGDWCLDFTDKIISKAGMRHPVSYIHNTPKNIKKIYSTNCNTLKNIAECLPLGVLSTEKLENTVKKTNLLFANFDFNTNIPIRLPIMQWCLKQDWIICNFPERGIGTSEYNLKIFDDYINYMKSSKYIISPPGTGLDCYRTWEALYCNTIPIVIDCNLYRQFNDLPIIRISDINELSPQILEIWYDFLIEKINNKIYKNYWHTKIKESSDKII